MPSGERAPVVITDPRAMRALAHPARMAVIDELFGGREMTATEAAELVDLSPSAMSYHLRALEKWGVIERVPAAADGRERPWRAAGDSLQMRSAGTTGSHAAESAFVMAFLDQVTRDVTGFVERGEQPDDQSVITSNSVWMTDDEAAALNAAVLELFGPYRSRRSRAERSAGSRRTRIAYVLVPTEERDTRR